MHNSTVTCSAPGFVDRVGNCHSDLTYSCMFNSTGQPTHHSNSSTNSSMVAMGMNATAKHSKTCNVTMDPMQINVTAATRKMNTTSAPMETTASVVSTTADLTRTSDATSPPTIESTSSAGKQMPVA